MPTLTSYLIVDKSYLMWAKLPTLCLKYGLTTQNVNSNLADNDLAIDSLLQFALVYYVTNNLVESATR